MIKQKYLIDKLTISFHSGGIQIFLVFIYLCSLRVNICNKFIYRINNKKRRDNW